MGCLAAKSLRFGLLKYPKILDSVPKVTSIWARMLGALEAQVGTTSTRCFPENQRARSRSSFCAVGPKVDMIYLLEVVGYGCMTCNPMLKTPLAAFASQSSRVILGSGSHDFGTQQGHLYLKGPTYPIGFSGFPF